MLTIPQSVRVGKLWFSLLELNGANFQWNYWTIHNDELTRLCQDVNLEDLIHKNHSKPQGSAESGCQLPFSG